MYTVPQDLVADINECDQFLGRLFDFFLVFLDPLSNMIRVPSIVKVELVGPRPPLDGTHSPHRQNFKDLESVTH